MTDNVYINIGKHAVDRFLERSPQEAKVLGIVKDYGYNGFEELDNLRYNQFLLSEYFRRAVENRTLRSDQLFMLYVDEHHNFDIGNFRAYINGENIFVCERQAANESFDEITIRTVVGTDMRMGRKIPQSECEVRHEENAQTANWLISPNTMSEAQFQRQVRRLYRDYPYGHPFQCERLNEVMQKKTERKHRTSMFSNYRKKTEEQPVKQQNSTPYPKPASESVNTKTDNTSQMFSMEEIQDKFIRLGMSLLTFDNHGAGIFLDETNEKLFKFPLKIMKNVMSDATGFKHFHELVEYKKGLIIPDYYALFANIQINGWKETDKSIWRVYSKNMPQHIKEKIAVEQDDVENILEHYHAQLQYLGCNKVWKPAFEFAAKIDDYIFAKHKLTGEPMMYKNTPIGEYESLQMSIEEKAELIQKWSKAVPDEIPAEARSTFTSYVKSESDKLVKLGLIEQPQIENEAKPRSTTRMRVG